MKLSSDLRFFLFLVKIQWRDRIATSAFLMGITIQTALLAVSVYKISSSPEHAMALAVRGSFLTCVGIALFSAMSNIQNEFRYGTIEAVMLGKISLNGLVLLRSMATAVVSSPAVVIPFAAAALRYPELASTNLLVTMLASYFVVGLTCFQCTYILNAFSNPGGVLPWLKGALLIFGLNLIPFPLSELLAKAFPSYWVLIMAQNQGKPQSTGLPLLAASLITTALLLVSLRGSVTRKVEEKLVSGRIGG